MKNRMDVPQEYSPVLPSKVQEAPLAKKKAQETDQELATHTDCDRRRESDYADGACESQFARYSLIRGILHPDNSKNSNSLV